MGRGVWVLTFVRTTAEIADAASHSRGTTCPRFVSVPPSWKAEGAGKTGCALHPRSRVHLAQQNAHTSIQVQRRTPGLPCAMVLRLIRGLPGEASSIATIASQISPQGLTPAFGRRNHTTSPSASATLVFVTSAATASHRNVRDDGRRPSG